MKSVVLILGVVFSLAGSTNDERNTTSCSLPAFSRTIMFEQKTVVVNRPGCNATCVKPSSPICQAGACIDNRWRDNNCLCK
jgi:hypothetical protein